MHDYTNAGRGLEPTVSHRPSTSRYMFWRKIKPYLSSRIEPRSCAERQRRHIANLRLVPASSLQTSWY